MRLAAEMLQHKALGFPWNVPAFGEEVGIWRSHDKKQAKSAHNKGAVGRLIAIDLWGNGTCILSAKGTDIQDPELVLLKPNSMTHHEKSLGNRSLGRVGVWKTFHQSKCFTRKGDVGGLKWGSCAEKTLQSSPQNTTPFAYFLDFVERL